MTRLPLPWKDEGAGGEGSAPLGTYCTGLCPLQCHPLNAYDLLRTDYGPAGHTGKQQKGRPAPSHG